jgi:hypothetical protein
MLRYVLRATLATALMFGVSTLAVAQYGGGGGMGGGGMPGSPTYTPHGTYSSKGAIIGGIAGGADSGEPMFEVHKMSKDLGQCTATTAEQR